MREQNVWANPITFDNRGQPRKPVNSQGWINGDGVLIYPGEEKLHPEEDRGLHGPVSTVQLANFRRGLQDHQYLTLARKLGLNAEVEAAVRAVVPRVFSEVPRGGAVASPRRATRSRLFATHLPEPSLARRGTTAPARAPHVESVGATDEFPTRDDKGG